MLFVLNFSPLAARVERKKTKKRPAQQVECKDLPISTLWSAPTNGSQPQLDLTTFLRFSLFTFRHSTVAL